jgi:hypothetical protein
VTVGNGVAIQGTAEAVTVVVTDMTTVFNPATLAAYSATGGAPYVVDVLVTPGTRGPTNQPPTLALAQNISIPLITTRSSFILAAGGATAFPIPQDAGVLSAKVESFAAGIGGYLESANLIVSESDGVQTLLIYYPINDPGYVTIAPGATQFIVSNQGAVPLSVTITWGIDG